MMETPLGLNTDVYFGDVDRPLPDWRAEQDKDDPDTDDEEPTEDDIAAAKAILGFDPDELED
jgi:hypothetical protein